MTSFAAILTDLRFHARRATPGFLVSLAGMYGLWRTRRALAELEPHLLADVGLTAEEAEKEANRPAWDVPGHWKR